MQVSTWWAVYRILVYHPGEKNPRVTLDAPRGSEALALIPQLLAEHSECERVVVMHDQTRLFAVDCKGNRLP
jgi:hypothetical protein